MEDKQSKSTATLISAEETTDISEAWDTKPEAGKRKLEIHLSTEVLPEYYELIRMRLYAVFVDIPLSVNDMQSLLGNPKIEEPWADKVYLRINTGV